MILPPMSTPWKAWADLKAFLQTRQRNQWLFAFVAVAIPAFFAFTFYLASGKEKDYVPPEVIFVKPWKPGRTDAEIRAQQRKDQPAERAARKAQAEAEAAYKAKMKAIEDALN